MRILLVNHFPLEGSGSGVYTKNLASRLLKQGHQVKVIVVDDEVVINTTFPVRTILYYRFPCFTTHPKSNQTFYTLSQWEMNEYLRKFKIAIREEVESFKPDLIHCQHLWVAPYAASMTGLPYIVTAHGTDIKGFKSDKRFQNIALEGARDAKKVITISGQVNKDVKRYYDLPEEKLELILNGFDEGIFKPLDLDRNEVLKSLVTENTDQINYIVNFAGKLTKFKGVDLLIKAAKIYEEEIPGVITLINGHGHLKGELQKLAEKLNIKSIFFLGNQTQETLVRLYNIADISVVPSRMEPFGLVAIESLACGTPVIASDAGGLPDFINNRVGKLFKMGNHRKLARKVIDSLQQNDKETKGTYAAKYALNNFSWNRVVQELTTVYKSVLPGKEVQINENSYGSTDLLGKRI